jgi:hypothetical protein
MTVRILCVYGLAEFIGKKPKKNPKSSILVLVVPTIVPMAVGRRFPFSELVFLGPGVGIFWNRLQPDRIWPDANSPASATGVELFENRRFCAEIPARNNASKTSLQGELGG